MFFLLFLVFLITRIIYRQSEAGIFSLVSFWKRRIRRLYPALLTVVAVTSVVANWLMVYPMWGQYSAHALSAIFSYSNFWLILNTGGYWDSGAEGLPLLHTWSLSLEEQFYLVYPLMFVLCWRYKPKYIELMLWVTCLLSFGLCVVMSERDPQVAFYLLPTRVWELSLGCLVGLRWDRLCRFEIKGLGREVLWVLGILLVLGSFALIRDDYIFPGAWPAIPCLGTVILLISTQYQSRLQGLSSSRVLRYIGKISYSLYLWHWPVIVFSGYFLVDSKIMYYGVLVLVMFVLGSLSYHFIETPFRKEGSRGMRYAGFVCLVAIGMQLPMWMNPSNPWQGDNPIVMMDDTLSYDVGFKYKCIDQILSDEGGVRVGKKSDVIDIMLVGSSHARTLSGAFDESVSERELSGMVMGVYSVDLMNDRLARDSTFNKIDEARLKYIQKSKPKILIVAGRWAQESEHGEQFYMVFEERLRFLKLHCGVVLVLSQVPEIKLPDRYDRLLRKYLRVRFSGGLDDGEGLVDLDEVVRVNQRVREIVDGLNDEGVVYVDIYKTMLRGDGFVRFHENEKILYYDKDHLNLHGARYVFDRVINPILDKLTEKKKSG